MYGKRRGREAWVWSEKRGGGGNRCGGAPVGELEGLWRC